MKKTIGFIDSNLTGNGFTALKVAKELGCEVIFITRSLDEYLAINGTKEYFDQYVDKFIFYKESNAESIVESIAHQHFDGIITFSDYHVLLATEVARKLNLRGLHPEAAQKVRNKYLTREACRLKGVPGPKYINIRTEEGLEQAIEEVGTPFILKPLDESASEGVRLCKTRREALDQFRYIVNKGLNTRGQKTIPQVLVEEYLVGHEISVEALVNDSKVTFLGCTDKELLGDPYFVEAGHTFPSLMPENLREECYNITKQALQAIDYNFGIAHIELKLTVDGPKIIEINGRPAGDRIADLISISTGIDIVKELILLAIGEYEDVEVKYTKGATIRFLTPSRKGTVKGIKGADLLKYFPYINDYKINAKEGQEVKELKSNRERIGYVLTSSDNSYNSYRFALAAHSKINIDIE